MAGLLWQTPDMPLTDLQCRKTKPRGTLFKLSDMGGLQLWVFPTGSKLWRYAYRFGGKQKLLALGRYPDTSLFTARMERDKAKLLLKGGRDPNHARRVEKLEQAYPGDSFDIVANEYLDKLRREERAEITVEKVSWLLDFARPLLGPMSISSIRPIDVLSVLQAVERRGRYETARRLRSTIGAVCRYGIATARATVDPTAGLQGALITPKVKPRAAITDAKALAAFLRALDAFDGSPVTAAALKLTVLLFPRPGELRHAQWPEFDLSDAVWTVPASRMKMRKPHAVPLAPQAIAILAELKELVGSSRFLTPCLRTPDRPMSENTLNAALRRLGYSKQEATAHGFRATASTLLNESGLWHADAIERQLAHAEDDDVRRAYARGAHWDERVRMMRWWADRLDELRQRGEIVALS